VRGVVCVCYMYNNYCRYSDLTVSGIGEHGDEIFRLIFIVLMLILGYND
jgi:hypothetical protein